MSKIRNILLVAIILAMLGCTPALDNPIPTLDWSNPTRINPTSTDSNITASDPTSTLAATPMPEQTLAYPTPETPTPLVTHTPPSSELNIPQPNIFGITLYPFVDEESVSKALQAGASWMREMFIWSDIEPTPGDRRWNKNLDDELIHLSSLNVQLIMLIEGTPLWALKEGFNCGAVAESQFDTLGKFTYDLVKRYSAPPFNIRYWELWNEPDAAGVLGCWGDPGDPIYFGGYYYGQMLQAVYPRIKEADPSAQVLVGGLLLDCDPIDPPVGKDCLPAKFLEGILAGGAGPDFDGVSFHAYDYYSGNGMYENYNWHSTSGTTGPVSIAKSRYLKKVLSDYGYGQKYLINTETAVFWGPNVLDPPCDPNVPPNMEVTKVKYIVQSYAVARAEGWKANLWYSALGARCSGLLNSDRSPKAAYYAYQLTQQKLFDAVYLREINEYNGIMGYEFQLTGKSLWVIWALGGRTISINLPRPPIEVDRVGEDGLPISEVNASTITIDSSPLFIEFER